MNLFYPPIPFKPNGKVTIFLAGSIENGKAEDWQFKVIDTLYDYDINILNPRRLDWNPDWDTTIHNHQFVEQVTWELDGLDIADLIIMNIIPDTISPISLLELGKFADSNKMMVCCPNGYFRKGNVDIVCQRYNIPTFENLYDMIKSAKEKINDR